MKPKTPRRKILKTPLFRDGRTRSPDSPLDEGAAESFRAVEPALFRDHPRSSLEAAVVDPDVADSEGGE
jgi:hypothetical protein